VTAFLATFLPVSAARLGDKTQLATAVFAAAGDRSRWLVFLASSMALVALAGIARSLDQSRPTLSDGQC
jgi:putative Ca2+/H+ antiporter (TMEM165/GDT1 family)